MSYEQALETMRGQAPNTPSFSDVSARPKWRATISTTQWLVAFTSLLAASSFGAVALAEVIGAARRPQFFWNLFTQGPGLASLLPAVLLVVAARAVLRRRFTSQMLVRAIWWSNLIVGALMGHLLGDELLRTAGITAALFCALALLSLDRQGLESSVEDAADGAFRPIAFRGLLTLALVMAFADAQTLAFSGIIQCNFGPGWSIAGVMGQAGYTLLSACVMGLAVWGLLRLKTWALVLNLVANLVIAALALWGVLGVSVVVGGTLALTAAIQAFLPVPILALAVGGARAEKSAFLHRGHAIAMALVLVMMAIAGSGLMRKGFRYTGWLDYQGHATHRGAPPLPIRPSVPGRD